MRVLLTRVTGDSSDEAVLDAALAVARHFRAHIEALFVAPDPRAAIPYMGEGMSAGLIEQLYTAAEKELAATKARTADWFDAWRRRHDVPLADRPGRQNDVSIAWSERLGDDSAIIGRAGRVADMTVLARMTSKEDIRGRVAAEAAMFDTGRPTLLVPPGSKMNLAGNAIVAWNGSREAARALAASLPFLEAAGTVEIVSVAEADKSGVETEAAKTYLAWHDIEVIVTRCTPRGSVAETIFDAAHRAEASLVVMGAYTHTRLREMVFGGVTEYVLTRADIPVLTCH